MKGRKGTLQDREICLKDDGLFKLCNMLWSPVAQAEFQLRVSQNSL